MYIYIYSYALHCTRSIYKFYYKNLDREFITTAIHRALTQIYMKFLIHSIRD